METSEGFAAIARADAKVLILGSLPGRKSLDAQQYYAHPRNAFWPIMRELYGIEGAYQERCLALVENRIALWDVLAASRRPGSLDASIQLDSAKANDFDGFLARHSEIELLAFNGAKAEELFRRFVQRQSNPGWHTQRLPSTSPAYAALSFSGKLTQWRDALLSYCGQ